MNNAIESGGGMLRQMLETSRQDPSELKVILDLLAHRLHWTLQFADNTASVMNPFMTSQDTQATLDERLSGDILVWVRSSGASQDKRLNHAVQMKCPQLSVIRCHSLKLMCHVENLISSWTAAGVYETASHGNLVQTQDISILEGNYEVWQEVIFCYCFVLLFTLFSFAVIFPHD